jgi:hypothetical protein
MIKRGVARYNWHTGQMGMGGATKRKVVEIFMRAAPASPTVAIFI